MCVEFEYTVRNECDTPPARCCESILYIYIICLDNWKMLKLNLLLSQVLHVVCCSFLEEQ